MTRSQAFRRPPRFARAKVPRLATVPSESGELTGRGEQEASEEDEPPALLTFSSLEPKSESVSQARQQREQVDRSSRGYSVGENRPLLRGRGSVTATVPHVTRSIIGSTPSSRPAEKNQRENSTSMSSSYSDIIDGESTNVWISEIEE